MAELLKESEKQETNISYAKRIAPGMIARMRISSPATA